MNKILVIMLRYIGDVLLATPVLRGLRDRFPSAEIVMVVNQGTQEVLKRNPDVDLVLPLERTGLGRQLRFLQRLRRHGFDCVIDLTDADRSAVLARVTGAPIRIGYNEERYWRGWLYTRLVRGELDRMHRIERNLEALRLLGIEPKTGSLVLRVSAEDDAEGLEVLRQAGVDPSEGNQGRRLVMFQPGARYWFKAWPADRFAALADQLAERCGCVVLVGGGADEHERAGSIRDGARSAVTVLAGRTTLTQYAAILKRCALFVGNDNGPMHMAAALGVPVAGLFGPSNPAQWGPRGPRTRVIYKGLDCRPCFHPGCDRGEESCMRRITVEEVFAAAVEMLEAGAGIVAGRSAGRS